MIERFQDYFFYFNPDLHDLRIEGLTFFILTLIYMIEGFKDYCLINKSLS
jgi:hypothetical protein